MAGTCQEPQGNTVFHPLMKTNIKKRHSIKKFTCEQIIDSIREYNFLEISKKGYIPAYECSEIYDSLHNVFGFYNDKEIISYDQMNKIIKS